MTRNVVISMVIAGAIFLFGVLNGAHALDVNAAFGLLKAELLNNGMAANDIKAVEPPVKSMFNLGGSPADLKTILLGFMAKGFKGNDFSSLVLMVSDLAKNGEPVKNAGTFVTQAIQAASPLGLKGKDLIMKVQNIVNQRKTQLSQVKSNISATAGEQLKTPEDIKKSITSTIFGK